MIKNSLRVIDKQEPKLCLETVVLNHAVDTLEFVGGDIDAFCERFDQPKHFVLFQLEKRLREHGNPELRERWEKSIEIFYACKMRSLQRDAIRRAETFDATQKQVATLNLAFFKVMVGDLLTGANVAARRRASAKDEPSTVLAEGIDAMESPEIDDGEQQ